MISTSIRIGAISALVMAGAAAWADGNHDSEPGPGNPSDMIRDMREAHAAHEHEHEFEVLGEMSDEDLQKALGLLRDLGLAVPSLDSHRGREVFMEKGCVICHSVNGVGGEIGPAFDAAEMPEGMNAFEFAARMWRGAPAMVVMQEDLLGSIIELDGHDLADIVAFVHDAEEQKEVTMDDVPAEFRELIEP